ncbi:MAG: DciA family protein [bacterium]
MRSLREVLERAAPPGVLEAARVLQAWEKVAVAEGLRGDAEYRAGRLLVSAYSSADAQELALRRESLRRRVNQHLGAEIVRELRVRSGAAR